jgi:hypothetical protein
LGGFSLPPFVYTRHSGIEVLIIMECAAQVSGMGKIGLAKGISREPKRVSLSRGHIDKTSKHENQRIKKYSII